MPDLVYQWLREQILDSSLPPGSEIRQELIAKEFRSSRVPVREALSRLQAEGLIILRPRRGFAVAYLSHDEIVEVFGLRMAIEEHATRIATKVRTDSDICEVEALVELMETLDPSASYFLKEWMTTNRLFHTRLIECARQKRVSELALNLRDAVEPYMRIEANFNKQVNHANVEHRQILDAFKKRDVEAAGRLSRKHCESTLKRLVTSIDFRNEHPFPIKNDVLKHRM